MPDIFERIKPAPIIETHETVIVEVDDNGVTSRTHVLTSGPAEVIAVWRD